MASSRRYTVGRLGLAVVTGSVLIGAPSSLSAQDVTLNPGFISGAIQVGNEALNHASVSASGAGFSSSATVSPPSSDPTSASYTLTINVPEGTSPTYNVNATASLDNGRDRLTFAPASVVVDEGATSIVDFVVVNPGFVEADVTVAGGTVSSVRLDIRRNNSTYPRSFTSGSLSSPVKVAVVPGTDLRIITTVYLTNGLRIDPPDRSIDVAPGQTVVLDYDLTAPTAPTDTGSITGTVAMPGPLDPDRHRVVASGPTSRSTNVYGDGPYALNDLLADNYSIYATSYFNSLDDSFRHPYASLQPDWRVAVPIGGAASVDISTDQAFLEGSIDITGSASPADLRFGTVGAFGASGTDAQGGYATDRVTGGTGAYDLVVSGGSWSLDYVNLSFSRPDPGDFLSQSFFFRDYVVRNDPIALSTGGIVQRDLELAMGQVTVTFQIAGGGLFSHPRLSGYCELRDGSNQLLSNYSFSSTSSGQIDVETGQVSFIGTEGTCTVTAVAFVGGSFTTFGWLTIDVVPGTQQVVDIGGPGLTVEFPEPNLITSHATIEVTGRASDDVAVAGVTVNGVDAALTSTNNPADPNEVAFSATIPLDRGPNEIVTVATDTADPANASSDTRTVFRDEAPPSLSWTPDDGAVVPATGTLTSVSVSGTADDDAGIDSILVEGASVAFTSTGNGNEVAFTTSLDLPVGLSFVEVVATDISNRSTAQTHEITVTENRPPVADVGGPYTVDEGATVTLDASGSTDDDGDTLTYAWDLDGDGAFDDATGPTPTFDASGLDGPASAEVRVEVSDGQETATASATVTVNNVAPAVTAGANQTADEGAAVSTGATFDDPAAADTHTVQIDWGDGATGTSLGDSHAYADDGTYTVTVTVTDDDGGVGSGSLTVTVLNVAPVVTAGADQAVSEGDTVRLAADFIDPGADAHSVTVNWGDGSTGGGLTGSHAYADDGVYTVTVTVTDDDGGVGVGTLTVSVANVAPTLGPIAAPIDPVPVGQEVTASANFADPGFLDTHTVQIDWGDGASGSGTVASPASGSHVYTVPGIYTVAMTLADDDGGSDTGAFQFIVVYDPEGGFVTGGGHIHSPEGAYVADASLAGKATFGFVSKYKKGTTVPTGNTEFQFHAAALNFKSTDYEWLVVSGPQSKFKGHGMLNGSNGYGFMLYATDGAVNGGGGADRFRIKIWDAAENVVYDNEIGAAEDADPTTTIQGGSIVIHDGGKKSS